MTVQEVIEYLEQHGFIADEVKDMCIEALVQVEQYRALGTLEELKEAREKQVAKSVQKLESKMLIADGWQYQCPQCKCAVGINQHAEEQTQEDNYCPTCGQALKWGEED